MPTKKAKTRKQGKNYVDVRRPTDIPMLENIMGKNKKMIVLIYADYCGHCHTYRDNIWNEFVKNPKRTTGMASIHYDQLDKTDLPKVSGYPTVYVLGEDKQPMKFKNEQTGEETFDYPESRNKDKMAELLYSDVSEDEETAELDDSAKESRLKTTEGDVDSLIQTAESKKRTLNPKKMPTPPNVNEDMLNSQNINSTEFTNKTEKTVGGGSLYKALLESFSPKRYTHKRRGSKKRESRRA
jgi:Thioredoxin